MNKKARNNVVGYSFISPAAILLIIFMIIPIAATFYYSLTSYNGFRSPQLIGIENFKEILNDLAVYASLRNTLVFVLVSVPFQVVISLAIAALIAANYRNRFGEFVRGTMFIPVLCSATLVGTIFSYLFAADAGGFVNMLLGVFGLKQVNWLGSEETALGVLIFVYVWKSVGYYMVVFYAGIMDIPNDLYEVSDLDGATKLQQFFYVTLPNLKTVLFTVITVCTIWSFQVFDLAYTMTAGGPGYATTSLVYQIYLQAFKGFNFGYASAIAVVLFIFVLGINLIQRIFMKDEE